MPWGVAAAAVTAGAGLASSSKASKGQQKAADAALEEQRRQYDLARNDQAPWREAGQNALASLTNLSGQFGKVPTAEEVMAGPGYQFGLSQGLDAIQGTAAANGGLYSGATGKALTRFGNDYATSKFNDAFNQKQAAESSIWNRYAGLAGIGQSATNQLAQLGQNYANQAGQIGMNNANAQGAAAIANANTIGNFANQAGAAWGSWNSKPNAYTTPDATGAYANPTGYTDDYRGATLDNSLRGGMADGGEVRREPKIGSRSPLRSGGMGGGMSKNALMLIVQEPEGSPVLLPMDIGQLPANPVTNPRAILENRMRQAQVYADGGQIYGPGGVRDDLVPINASAGEHMMDGSSVRGAGTQDLRLDRGNRRLNKLRALLQELDNGA